MESSQSQNPSSIFKSTTVPAEDQPQLDLYTIPAHSSWFSWDNIHEIERQSLKEFFDTTSFTRTQKIYKEYRDFIITKYRENPSRRLNFTEVRKFLVGDVGFLHKVFVFLEKWGLINFGVENSIAAADEDEEDREDDRWKLQVEEGAPYGVKIVATPGSSKPAPPLARPVTVRAGGREFFGVEAGENGFKLPPLASHSDVYGDLKRPKGLFCGNCKGSCDSGYYEHNKGSFMICVNCFKNGNYGENNSMEDFKLIGCIPNNGSNGSIWTEAETLLLLESVLKHGDDWQLVAENVQTKSKLDCISKLIQLPFGELMLGSAHRKGSRLWEIIGEVSSVKQAQLASTKSQESMTIEDESHGLKNEGQSHELKNESQQNGDAEDQEPPLKRIRTSPASDASSLLMKQVALISMMAGPRIAATAADAAVTALCYENLCPREIFDGYDDESHELGSSLQNKMTERISHVEDSQMEEKPTQLASDETQDGSPDKYSIPLTLRIRAASATALGAAAAHARLLADQEDREVEHLVAIVIEEQLKVLQRKIKHVETLELIMENERIQMQELEESLLAERINVLQRVFNAGISKRER